MDRSMREATRSSGNTAKAHRLRLMNQSAARASSATAAAVQVGRLQ